MKFNALSIFFLIYMCLFSLQNCERNTNYKKAFTFNSEFENILNQFVNDLNHTDSVSIFVIIKNIDANSAKYYLVGKKPLRSDFDVIGIPAVSMKIKDKHVYFFNGIEKIIKPDSIFWKEHLEIFDNRKKQDSGIYDIPIIKKELHFFYRGIWQEKEEFDDHIFIGSPKDTLKFTHSR